MSNSVVSNLLHHSLIHNLTIINTSPSVSGNYILFSPRIASNLRKPPLFTKFSLDARRKRSIMSSNCRNAVVTWAVLATDSPFEVHFTLFVT